MRNGLLLGGLVAALAVAALVISIIALVAPPDAPDELYDYGFHLLDRGEVTVELVRQALRRYDEEGREATVSYYNSPESVDGDWYVFVVDENEKLIAHRDPSLLGKHIDEVGNTIDGRRFSDLEVTEAGRWVDDVFVNPATGDEGIKHSWVMRHDGLIIGSGWYE